MQETLLAIHNWRHTFDPAQPINARMHGIAPNKFVDTYICLASLSTIYAIHYIIDI